MGDKIIQTWSYIHYTHQDFYYSEILEIFFTQLLNEHQNYELTKTGFFPFTEFAYLD